MFLSKSFFVFVVVLDSYSVCMLVFSCHVLIIAIFKVTSTYILDGYQLLDHFGVISLSI
jgi:hypothetical protein